MLFRWKYYIMVCNWVSLPSFCIQWCYIYSLEYLHQGNWQILLPQPTPHYPELVATYCQHTEYPNSSILSTTPGQRGNAHYFVLPSTFAILLFHTAGYHPTDISWAKISWNWQTKQMWFFPHEDDSAVGESDINNHMNKYIITSPNNSCEVNV